jgi:hypothetical protein
VKIAVLLLLARAMRRSEALDLFPAGALAQTAHKCCPESSYGFVKEQKADLIPLDISQADAESLTEESSRC